MAGPTKCGSNKENSLSPSIMNFYSSNICNLFCYRLVLLKWSCYISLIYWPHQFAGKLPAPDVLEKKFYYHILHPSSSESFLFSFIMVSHIACQKFYPIFYVLYLGFHLLTNIFSFLITSLACLWLYSLPF